MPTALSSRADAMNSGSAVTLFDVGAIAHHNVRRRTATAFTPTHVLIGQYGLLPAGRSSRPGLAWSRAESKGPLKPQSAPIAGSSPLPHPARLRGCSNCRRDT